MFLGLRFVDIKMLLFLTLFIYTLLWLQDSLESFLPDMDSLIRHRQVVLLICGLMSDPTPIIQLVYKHWIDGGQKSAGKTLIETMFHEAGLPVPKSFLHNQWINYYNHGEGLINDTAPVYVPSRLYRFINMKANVSCNIQHGQSKIPECTISIMSPHEAILEKFIVNRSHNMSTSGSKAFGNRWSSMRRCTIPSCVSHKQKYKITDNWPLHIFNTNI